MCRSGEGNVHGTHQTKHVALNATTPKRPNTDSLITTMGNHKTIYPHVKHECHCINTNLYPKEQN